MKNNLRNKFRDFLTSEEGRIGVKTPLAVGIAGGSLLLAQAMLPTSVQAHGHHECPDCDDDQVCIGFWLEWSPDCELIPGVQGCWVALSHVHYTCVDLNN